MAQTIDLNCDMGESFGAYTIGMDDEMLSLVSSANIACGFHGGDPRVMERTITRAVERGVGIGAHVGFPDLVGFGRRPLQASAGEIRTDVIYQIGALYGFCRALGVGLQHVKAHGALANMAFVSPEIAAAIAAGVAAFDRGLPLLVIPDTELSRAAAAAGLPAAYEGYADRNYESDGTLVSRRHPQAVIHDADEAGPRVVRMARAGKIRTLAGTDLTQRLHTICIHGDNPAAVALARRIRRDLDQGGISVMPLGKWLD